MKGVIYCVSQPAEWSHKYFRDIYPYLLKFANKPLLEYYLDYFILAGVKEVRIVMEEPSSQVEAFIEDGSRWGIQVSYGLSRPGDSLRTVFQKNGSYCKNQELLIIEGFHFIHYDRMKPELFQIKTGENSWVSSCETGRIIHVNKEDATSSLEEKLKPALSPIDLVPIQNINHYFQISQKVIREWNKEFVLPGYNNEEGVYIGINVELSPNTRIEKPVILGDNTQFKKLSILGPGAIVGDNVIIDNSTQVENSIIYGNSYVGSDLEIINKIIYRNTLISPQDDSVIHLNDRYLISRMRTGSFSEPFRRSFHWIVGLLLFLIGMVPFILVRFFMLITGSVIPQEGKFYYRKDKRTLRARYLSPSQKGVMNKLYYRLSMDKYPLLVYVLSGKMALAGNYLVPSSPENACRIEDMPVYLPGVFSYSEMNGTYDQPNLMELDELFYSNHISLMLDIRIVVKNFINRLFLGK